MYQEHFHLKQEPFSIAPDPSFLYLSKAHKEALAHLMYGFSHGGFVLITGEVGTGKTTLLRNLLKQTPSDLDVAFVLNPRLTVRELLETLCQELGVHYDPQATQTVKQYIDTLNRHLLRTHQLGRSTVVIIDEAQNLSPAVLEQVRLLTNLETDEKKLMRIILVGQPELSDLLARQELRQLAQRITARYHLGSLSREDCYAYVAHRLSRAGGHPQLFTNAALRRLYRLSQGTPRIINVIADRALLGAYSQGQQRVNATTVGRAAREVLGRDFNYPAWIAAGAGLVALAVVGWLFIQPRLTDQPPADQQSAVLTQNNRQGTSAAADIGAADIGAADIGAAENRAPGTGAAVQGSTGNTAGPSAAASGTLDRTTFPDKPGETDRTAINNAGNQTQFATSEAIVPASAASSQSTGALKPPTGSESLQADVPAAAVALLRPMPGDPMRPPGNPYQAQRQAYAAVFARWGADYFSASEPIVPCDFAPSAGLLCLSQFGSWSNIAQTDLPVVLELWDEQSAPYHAALTRMQDEELTLTIGEKKLRTTARDLREVWFGAYVVIWQTPPGYRGSIRQGDTHETVGWLRQQMSGVSESPLNSSTPNYFDDTLHDAVVGFQRQEGLIIDGVVGPATWIRLSTRLRLPAPRLRS